MTLTPALVWRLLAALVVAGVLAVVFSRVYVGVLVALVLVPMLLWTHAHSSRATRRT